MSIRTTMILFSAVLAVACSSSRKKVEYAELASPIARQKLESRIAKIKYQRGVILITNLERIAAYAEAAIPYCLDGLKSEEPMTRMGCAWVLGRVGDTRTMLALENTLGDDVDFVRYEAAASLGGMGSKAGYPVLVRGLEDERVDFRFRCFEALKNFTGHDFGYEFNAAPEAREVSLQKWDAWLERVESEEL